MPTKKSSSLSKYSSNLIQPAILIILLLLVWQIFSTNRSEEILKEQLDKTEMDLAQASFSLKEAQNNIDSLNTKITFFGEKSKLLALERDSLLLNFQRKTAVNWLSLQGIIERQKEVNAELTFLRNKNREFE